MKSSARIFHLFAASGVLLAATARSFAQTQWTNTLGGDWATGGNWSAGVPDSADAVTFVNGTYSITSSTAAMSASTVTTSSGQLVTFNLGAGNVLTLGGSVTANADTSLTSGAINATGSLIVGFPASNVDYLMDGSSTSMSATGLAVGRTVTTTNSSANTLTIQNGADFTLNTNALSIGLAISAAQANSNVLTVTGTGSTLAANAGIFVGNLNSATTNAQANNNSLVVNNGGAVTTTFLTVGRRSTGSLLTATGNTVTVGGTGTGTSLTATGVVTIGQVAGSNTLTVNSGGTVTATSADTTIGGFAGNALNVVGGTYDASGRTISVGSTAKMKLDGGSVTAGTLAVSGVFGNAADAASKFTKGTLNVTTLTSTPTGYNFAVGNNDGGDTATLNITGGGTHTFGLGLLIQNDGILAGSGNVKVGSGATIYNVGTIRPGSAMTVGVLDFAALTGTDPTLRGDYSTSVFDFNLASLASFDQVNLAGTLQLGTAVGNTLNLSLIDGFNPALGNTFDLFDFTALTGTFTNLNLPTLSGGLSWSTENLYTTGEISVIPEPASGALVLGGLGAMLLMCRRRPRR